MADNDLPDQDMERLLRQHFTEETPGLLAPTDTWTRLASRLEEQQPKPPGRFTAFRSILSQTWTSGRGLTFAGTALALIAVVALVSVLTLNGSPSYTEPVGSALYSGQESESQGPTAAPESSVLAMPDPSEQRIAPTAQEGRVIVEKETAPTSIPGKSSETTIAPTSTGRTVKEVVKEVASPVTEPLGSGSTLREVTVEKEGLGGPVGTPAPVQAPADTSTPPGLEARVSAPTTAPAPTTLPRRESGGQVGATAESAPQISIPTPYPQETPTKRTRRRRRRGGGGGYAPVVVATPLPQATPAKPTGQRRDGGGGSYARPQDTTFKDHQRLRFEVASKDNVSTFSLDTDRTSYQLALNWARSGYDVDPASVRTEEWINAFDYQYSPPPKNDMFSIQTDLIQHPLDDGKHLARIAFQAPELYDKAPLNVTLVLDASGSMQEGNRVDIARAAAESIRRSLRPQDRIAVVQFSGGVVHHLTVDHNPPDRDSVRRSIEGLLPRGSTNVQAGMDLGVQMAYEARRQRPEAHNYIILMSDGVANVDATNPFAILESAYDRNSRNPLRIITIGVGIQNYNDYLLEQLAQHGNGWYRYLDDVDSARRTFSRESWLAVSTPFADQTRAQVTWDPEVVRSWCIVGYENRLTPDETFTQDRKEFAEIPSGAATTVFYELELNEAAMWRGRDANDLNLGAVESRWVKPDTGVRQVQHTQISGDPRTTFDTSADYFLRLGAIVALASDQFSVLSHPEDDLAPGVHSELSTLQDRLQMLKGPLGELEAYRDLVFLLGHMADDATEIGGVEPRSGYSR